jgi:hypothetical protein
MARTILPIGIFLLILLTATFSRNWYRSTDASSSARDSSNSVARFDEPTVVRMTLVALASFAGEQPDVTTVLDLVNLVCDSVPMPDTTPTRQDDWVWWYVTPVPGHRVSVAFARGRENGIEMSRVKISLAPSVPVPDPYRAAGSVVDVKAFMDGDRPQLIGVVSYAASVHHDESSCRGGVEDEPTLLVGHRFRIDSAGATRLIDYTADVHHEAGRYVLTYNFGSLALEYDYAAPEAPARTGAADLFAALERRAPADA